jgi:predicted aspartyl protease
VDFDLIPPEGKFSKIYLPIIPVILSFEHAFPVSDALVDTGADMTLLPMEMRKYLGVGLDESKAIELGSAGGGGFMAIPSAEPIGYCIEKKGFRPIRWKGTVFFAPRQPIVLLGHHQCLDQLVVSVNGKTRKLTITKA